MIALAQCPATRVFRPALFASVLCLAPNVAFAVLPPYVYKERIEKSEIKAVAVVQSIKVLRTKRGIQSKMVTFKLGKAYFGTKVRATFAGQCESVLPWGRPPVGGTIYLYPKVGERVFVTVGSNGGSITSYTRMSARLDEALQKDPNRLKPGMASVDVEDGSDELVDRAEKLAREGAYPAAMAELEKAFAITSLSPRAYYVRAKVAEKTGKIEDGLGDYGKAIELQGDFHDAHLRRARLLAKTGAYEKAIADYEKCTSLRPKSAPGYNALAWFYATCPSAAHRDARKAVSLAKKAVKLDRQAHILDTLACAYAAKGDFLRAVETQREALSLCTDAGLKKGLTDRLVMFEQGQAHVEPDE